MKNKRAILILILFILAIVIYLLTLNSNINSLNSNTVSTSKEESDKIEIININSLNKISFENFTLNLPNNSFINTAFKVIDVKNIECLNSSGVCEVYEVIINGKKVYISQGNPIKFKSTSFNSEKSVVKEHTFNGNKYYVTYGYLEVFNEKGDVIKDNFITTQMNVCKSEIYCISTELFSNFELNNNQEVEMYLNLMQSLL